jgi:hypothetical protein
MKRRFAHITLALWMTGILATSAEETNAPTPATAATVSTNTPVVTNLVETVGVTNSVALTNAPATNFVASSSLGEAGPNILSTANSDQPSVPANGFDLRSFRIIYERNIFNPNRSPRSSGTPPPVTRQEPERRPTPRSESFALVGTMSYEKGSYAFFDGSSSQFRKVVQPDEAIAGFKVVSVTPKCVTLEHEGKTIELCVGMQLSKSDEEKDWRMQERPEAPASSGSSSSSSTASSGDAGADEVLRRLMEKRAQEGGPVEATTPSAPTIEIPPPSVTQPPEPAPSSAEEEILRRLQQRREQENQR